MKLSTLLLPDEYSSPYSAETIEITSVTANASAITEGALFLCLRGTRYDGHALLQLAARRGAAAAVVEEGADFPLPDGLALFTVKDVRRAFANICYRQSGCPGRQMHLAAVTGTNGKTTTSTMLYHILRESGLRAALIGTVCCHSEERDYTAGRDLGARRSMTTPDPDILYPMLREMEQDGITHVVMEASSHALALEKLAPLVFDVGIFTNLSPEHLDFHGTMADYLAAKGKLFGACRVSVLNLDDECGEALARRALSRVVRCGAVYHEENNAEEIRTRGSEGVSYTLRTPRGAFAVSVPMAGCFTVYNSLLAISAAEALGIEAGAASRALASFAGVAGRMERLPIPEELGFSVYIDYAHTERALATLLQTVCEFRREGERIVLLFGCGGDRDKSKRAPMGRVAEEYADFVIVTSDNCRSEEPSRIIQDILAGMRQREKRHVIVDRRRAIEYAITTARRGDIILLVGKGHEKGETVGGLSLPLDERELVREAILLRERNEKP